MQCESRCEVLQMSWKSNENKSPFLLRERARERNVPRVKGARASPICMRHLT